MDVPLRATLREGHVGAIIVAAGASTRLPGEVPKPFLPLGGRWVLERALAAFEATASIERVVVVVGTAHVAPARARLRGKVGAVVAGGPDRRDSVAAGLEALPDAGWVVVHDGARPFVTPALIDRVLEAARRSGAATAGLPVTDTLKEVTGDRVRRTVDRSTLWAVQTPQAFRGEVLREAHRRIGWSQPVTDDAELVERLGTEVVVVPGDPGNLKITTPQDLELARRLVETGTPVRVGVGYDTHRLVPDRPLVLGGVRIPHPRGLAGHSDGDALAHAVADALLGAAGQRDIGAHFPPDDPAYRGADSLRLLAEVARRLRAEGWSVVNVDAVVQAESPRLSPFVAAMRERLAGALGVEPERVAVKATTGEGLGPIGREEGIAAQAVALLQEDR
ncbi:MAG: 2-C-methyl-D-erythritol 4-phosphate cytidylyltransferase [Armatimonadota bacterium]|nr:2-C-methyl-D-erythritol 4-phosphate cytidylyltransferase [Armatimonadota bacterium]MDR7550123.1 2-C-methyl-D-erythritol 4-phosphate cytidylyltransferase [Armatimonadota bacterium]